MPIKTNCPSCGAQYKLADEMAGKNVQCKGCKNAFAIPSVASQPAETQQSPPQQAATPPATNPLAAAAQQNPLAGGVDPLSGGVDPLAGGVDPLGMPSGQNSLSMPAGEPMGQPMAPVGQPAWTNQEPQGSGVPKKKLIIIISAAVLLITGGLAAFFLLSGDDDLSSATRGGTNVTDMNSGGAGSGAGMPGTDSGMSGTGGGLRGSEMEGSLGEDPGPGGEEISGPGTNDGKATSTNRPTRPSKAILGQWKSEDGERELYISDDGSKDLFFTKVFLKDGTIETQDYVIASENAQDGELQVNYWFTVSDTGGKKPAGIGKFGDGRTMVNWYTISNDGKSLKREYLHFSDGRSPGGNWNYINDKTEP